jgi:hypothetical protein
MENKLKNHKPDDMVLFIVSDCRFRNEFDGFPDAFKVRLECDRDIRKSRCSQWRENDTHISETDLDGYAEEGKFDCVIDTGDLTVQECLTAFKNEMRRWSVYSKYLWSPRI